MQIVRLNALCQCFVYIAAIAFHIRLSHYRWDYNRWNEVERKFIAGFQAEYHDSQRKNYKAKERK